MTRYFLFLLLMIFFHSLSAQEPMNPLHTPHEQDPFSSANYKDAIDHYSSLAELHPHLHIQAFGLTDSGHPLHEVLLSTIENPTPARVREAGHTILYINNAIHPGEPCGVDASMQLARDLMIKPELKKLMDKTTIVIVPFYNISGGLNRGSYSRANQEGPKNYGFRGNI